MRLLEGRCCSTRRVTARHSWSPVTITHWSESSRCSRSSVGRFRRVALARGTAACRRGAPLGLAWQPTSQTSPAKDRPPVRWRMTDDMFEHPRLVTIYDSLDPDRSDLDVYAAIAEELGAGRVLDVGCGTGTFALLLADRGLEVTGVDPAGGSLAVARAKLGAERLHWIHGDATTLPPRQVDLATMTANVVQAIVDPPDWEATLRGVHDAVRPGGRLVFETRDPAYRAWHE